MATTQSSPTTSSSAPPPPEGIDPATWQAILAAGSQGSQSAPQSPIGVPYYVTDPTTGQPMTGPNGQPLRWGVPTTTTTTEDDLAFRGGRPGTRQVTSTEQGYQLPRYFDGDQWLPASLAPDQVASLQRKMVAAGLLKSGEAQLGVWDMTSVSAYQKLLAYANASGLDAQTALDRWGSAHAEDPNAGKAPLQVRVTNPDDLRQVFRKAVIDQLGEGWDQGKIDQMVSAYQGLETGAQTQAYNQQDTGGTTTAPPSPEAFAAAQAQRENPTGVAEHQALGVIDQFKQMIGGWQG